MKIWQTIHRPIYAVHVAGWWLHEWLCDLSRLLRSDSASGVRPAVGKCSPQYRTLVVTVQYCTRYTLDKFQFHIDFALLSSSRVCACQLITFVFTTLIAKNSFALFFQTSSRRLLVPSEQWRSQRGIRQGPYRPKPLYRVELCCVSQKKAKFYAIKYVLSCYNAPKPNLVSAPSRTPAGEFATLPRPPIGCIQYVLSDNTGLFSIRLTCHKNSEHAIPNLMPWDVFFQAENAPKLISVGTPPHFLTLDAFGISISAPLSLHLWPQIPNTNSWLRHCLRTTFGNYLTAC